MILFIGLGNPGKKYEKTRHNLGFQVIEEFAKKNNFSKFKLSREFLAEISMAILNGEKITMAKPQIFMNNSGKSVKSLTKGYKLEATNLFVIHDDIDIPLGKIKIVKNRGAAGHKGVESIIKEIGTKNFVRFRIGIQPKTGKPENVEKFVLQKFNKDEEKIIKEIIRKTVEIIETVTREGTEKTMSIINK